MNECKECIQVKNLEDKIKALWHQVEESKQERKDLDKRIIELERSSDVTEEKFDRIFNAIEAIEKNIEKIANSLEQIQTKSAKTYENLKYESIKYVIIATIAFAIAKFIK
jgi:septal ring factor EnvC (AmiA/AmiB activator)